MTDEQRVDSPANIALSARRVSKTFGAFRALVDADLTVRRGTVHALLGGNGSGKSTLIKCIAGVYIADEGELEIAGRVLDLPSVSPADARDLGLRFVHQDLGLFTDLSIAENMALSRGYPTRGGKVSDRELLRQTQQTLDHFEIEAHPSTIVAALRPSQRAMLAIARALDDAESDSSILILDEPTAALAEHDASELMASIRRRADQGQTIVLVSHRFNEITSVADDVTVFRDGRNVGSAPIEEMTIEKVVALMTGGAGRETPASFLHHEPGEVALKVSDFAAGVAQGVNFELGKGEVLGFAGLDGAGQNDVLGSLFGVIPRRAGEVVLEGSDYHPGSELQAMNEGVAYIPQDRHADAAFADMSVIHNITVSILDRVKKGLALSTKRELDFADDAITKYGIRASTPEAPLGVLSGGNQQKVVIARWLQRSPRLILLVEPTQGVDVVARQDIYRSISEATADGASALVASSDIDELLAITHRIAVFRRGRITAIIDTASTTRDEITQAMMAEEPVQA